MSTLKSVKAYLSKNFSVIPIKNRSKKPAISSWKKYQSQKPNDRELRKFWGNGSENGVAFVTGKISGLIILDADSPESVKFCQENFPDTVTVKTGRGYHYFFKFKNGIKSQVNIHGLKLDVRAEGAYAIGPPSVHPSGKKYKFVKGKSLDDLPLAQFPKSLLRENPKKNKSLNSLYKAAVEGSRNESLTKIAGSLARDKLSQREILDLLLAVNTSYSPSLKKKEVETIANSIFEKHNKGISIEELETFPASSLDEKDLVAPSYIIEGVVPEGLTLLCGKAKQGKSLFALDCAVAITTGCRALGLAEAKRGSVLGLFLEDTEKSLKARLDRILQFKPKPKKLHYRVEGIKFDNKGLANVNCWLDKHPDTRLVIIDTLQKVRPRVTGKSPLYQEDYQALEGLKKIADDRGIGILIIHHLRKTKSEDPLDTVSGTTGLTGCADSILVLTRSRGRADSNLFISGRNIEERELALEFNSQSLKWSILGDSQDFNLSDERTQILNLLRKNGKPMPPKKISEKLGKSRESIRYLLAEMFKNDQILKLKKGNYTIPPNRLTCRSVSDVSSDIDDF